MGNLERPIQVKFRVNEREREIIRLRMEKMNISNMGLYMRKVALGTPLYIIDISEINRMCQDVGGVSRNINQIAKRVNSTDMIYAEDIRQLKRKQEEIWAALNKIISKLP